ncbi:MoaD/ThiS family protein [uncultured Algibacter sp.]|jgi:molybdopterin synthase sulfur carrier subunit|uniref:MoaD/ThiS family protein n=1 Tax=uncultured Algibacter sp. TaxID=298659 RepID=UPI0025F7085B|nr:MoaD/ThiS family protein [uncultured Algibacter sp.]MDC1197236.1 MoaD/ThiS family protein [Algibacter sp.]
MYINIKYFGQIAELTQTKEENLEFSGIIVSELVETLYLKYSNLRTKNFQIAQNQELVSMETELTGNDIALLPPFAGG